MQQEISGVGQSSHLGRSTFVAYPTIYFTTPPPFRNEGTASFKAANGDEFFTFFTGTVTPNTDGTNTVVMEHEITGGTGRFEGATGGVTGFTIAVPGHTLHRELELYVEAGFTPLEALQAATVVPARVLGKDKELGTITIGKRADLVVVDGNPLVNIRDVRKIRLVIARGRAYEPATMWKLAGFTP